MPQLKEKDPVVEVAPQWLRSEARSVLRLLEHIQSNLKTQSQWFEVYPLLDLCFRYVEILLDMLNQKRKSEGMLIALAHHHGILKLSLTFLVDSLLGDGLQEEADRLGRLLDRMG